MSLLSWSLVRYILLSASRDKLMLTLLAMILLACGMGVFLGAAAIIEQGQFSLVFAAGGLRFVGVMGIVLFVCFHTRRSFEHKEVEFLLSRPLSRTSFILSHALAFMLLALVMTCAVVLPLFLLGAPQSSGLLFWGYSLAIEYMMMAATSLFFSMVLSSAAGSALATLGFYTLSRIIGTLIGISSQASENMLFVSMHKIMILISMVIPRLDLMGQTSWLIYGVHGSGSGELIKNSTPYAAVIINTLSISGILGLQGITFIFLILTATIYDFSRRRF